MDEHPYGQLEKIKINCSDSLIILRMFHFYNILIFVF